MGYGVRTIEIGCRVSRHNSEQDDIDNRAVDRLAETIRKAIAADPEIEEVVTYMSAPDC